MSLVRKMQKGDKSPTLYTHYGRLYDYDDLQRSADEGFDDFLGSIKRGNKDLDKFREAYSNLMSGIKDGTITFSNGRYYDSLGRYTNYPGKNKDKDYYGIVANYIYSKQGKSKEYLKPGDLSKIKWSGNTGIGLAFSRNLYGSDSGNLLDFLDLDLYNLETKKRATTNRAKRVSEVLQHIHDNFDSLFTEYSEADKKSSLSDIESAILSLKDGSIDAGDYLALSKAVGGVNFRNMFTSLEAEHELNDSTLTNNARNDFYNKLLKKYPIFSGTLHDPISLLSSEIYDLDTWNKLGLAIKGVSDEELFKSLLNSMIDLNYTLYNEPYIHNVFESNNPGFTRAFSQLALLNTLKNRNLLHNFGEGLSNLYYIPYTERLDNKQTAWVWDSLENTLKEMSYHDIPYWREKIRQEILLDDSIDKYLSSRYKLKSGGVLKAQKGDVMSRTKTENWLNIDNTYPNAINVNTWDNYYDNNRIDLDILSTNPWNKGYRRDDEGNIVVDQNGNIEYGLTAGLLGMLLNNLNLVGDTLSWNKKVNDTGYTKWNDLFDLTGLNSYFEKDLKRFDYMGPSTWNRHALLLRLLQNHGKDNPLVIGNESIYFDGNRWQLPLQGDLSTIPINIPRPSVNIQNTLSSIKSPSNKTEINLTNSRKVGDRLINQRIGLGILGLIPEAVSIGRLFDSLRTNNRVSETLRKALKPVLEDTYELYSPITGAFSEMLFRNRQAANVRRLAARPITSDAAMAMANNLDANRQASDLQYQGFLADDKEIKRTLAEALKRQEDNIARRSKMANKNRLSINSTNREIAELEATRLRRNWLSRDNYLQGVESRLRNKFEANRDRRSNFRLQTELANIDQLYYDAIRLATKSVELWKANNPGVPISAMPRYGQYEDFVREMNNWRNALAYGAHARVYGYPYNNPYLNKTPNYINGKYGYYGNGGLLKPNILRLINTVINNENNT